MRLLPLRRCRAAGAGSGTCLDALRLFLTEGVHPQRATVPCVGPPVKRPSTIRCEQAADVTTGMGRAGLSFRLRPRDLFARKPVARIGFWTVGKGYRKLDGTLVSNEAEFEVAE